MTAVILLAMLAIPCSMVWVWIDASGRDWPPDAAIRSGGWWFIAVVLLWILAFPYYLYERGRSTKRISLAGPAALPPPPPPTADWYPDPLGRYQRRYFDGDGWTARVQFRAGSTGVDPAGAAQLNSAAAAQPGTKTCPDCAETVLAAANVCKHCGRRFETINE